MIATNKAANPQTCRHNIPRLVLQELTMILPYTRGVILRQILQDKSHLKLHILESPESLFCTIYHLQIKLI
ncbi:MULTISPECIES: hypothetical protein [Nostocales]|uniref:hypothetical protein n=1 Tax=Nostocales TaxID=1161 RepID=UPI00168A3E58|nr:MULTISPECIES: hypothetical protein [Nostocales]MBD2474628.1 hypothetical protein [Anabaena sp. FACHB-83]